MSPPLKSTTPSSTPTSNEMSLSQSSAFAAGAISASILWGLVSYSFSWTLHRFRNYNNGNVSSFSEQQRRMINRGQASDDVITPPTNNDNNQNKKDNHHENETQNHTGSTSQQEQQHRNETNGSTSAYYNPWQKSHDVQEQHRRFQQQQLSSTYDDASNPSPSVVWKRIKETTRNIHIPRKKLRWPWESLRNKKHKSASSSENENTNTNDDEYDIRYSVNNNDHDSADTNPLNTDRHLKVNGTGSNHHQEHDSNQNNYINTSPLHPTEEYTTNTTNSQSVHLPQDDNGISQSAQYHPYPEPSHSTNTRKDSFHTETSHDADVASTTSSTTASTTSTTNNSTHNEKSGFCIGSIFGLDVGGTLAKLVYFEQSPQDDLQQQHHHQNYHHHHDNPIMDDYYTTFRDYGHHHHSNRSYSASASSSFPFHQTKSADANASFTSTSNNSHHEHNDVQNLRKNYSARDPLQVSSLSDFASISMRSQQHIFTNDVLPPIGDENYNRNDDDDNSNTFEPSHSRRGSVKIKRSNSMFDMSQSTKHEQRAQALNRFYTLVQGLDSHEAESGSKYQLKEKNLSFSSRSLGGEFHFVKFESRHMTEAMELIRAHNLHLNIVQIGATGGGAHKYEDVWEDRLGIRLAKQDELDSLVAGMQFVLADFDGECYTYKPDDNDGDETLSKDSEKAHSPLDPSISKNGDNDDGDIAPKSASFDDQYNSSIPSNNSTHLEQSNNTDNHSDNAKASGDSLPKEAPPVEQRWTQKVKRDVVGKSDSYPYMLVIIGTGVSVLRVDGPRKHERISGSTIGGGTYWGLCRLLTDVEDYESVLNLAERGRSSKVDMMVGDIYGEKSDALEKLGLTADVVASSFGKLVAKQDPAAGLDFADLARALLLMVTNNIGQVAYLNAQLHNTKRIYFVGNFLRHNVISQQRLSYAINYWSRGKMEALFLEHEGYFCALGSFLLNQGIPHENFTKASKKKSKLKKTTPARKVRSMSI